MAKSICPSCGLSAISLRTHLKRGSAPPWLRCQTCGAAVRHRLVSNLLGLGAAAMIIPSAFVATSSIDSPVVRPAWWVYTTIVAGLGLMVGSVVGAIYLSWRFVPLVPIPARHEAVLESGRRPLSLAMGPALYPALFVGLVGLMSRGPDRLPAAAVSFAVVYVISIVLLVIGGVYKRAEGGTRLSNWLLVGALGAYLFYFGSMMTPVAAVGIYLWPILVGGVWFYRRRQRDHPTE